MTIIKLEPLESGQHPIQAQSHRTGVWLEGYAEVPAHLVGAAWESCGYCDLTLEDGNLVGITPLPIPEPEPAPPETDPITETQLAVAELAQVMEENNTATQLAIAELAGIILGG